MVSAGIDIGSRTIKVALISDNTTVTRISETTFDPLAVCENLLDGFGFDKMTATGYGRHLIKDHYDCDVISEIKAFALGARALHDDCRTILDIGGQDIKVISLAEDGSLRKFEMNDRCAAGTGRFLEIMAMALGSRIQDFGRLALSGQGDIKLNSMCTVFAESEAISLLSKGMPRSEVALGIHKSIIGRVKAMLQRVAAGDEVIFAGGASLNGCLVRLIEQELGLRVLVPANPQLMGAVGCAIHNRNHNHSDKQDGEINNDRK